MHKEVAIIVSFCEETNRKSVLRRKNMLIWTIKACRLCGTPTYLHSTVKYCFKQAIYSTNTHRYTSLGTNKSSSCVVLTQVAVRGTALAGGGRVGVMGVIPVLLWLSEAGAALAG